nr:atherin-like [Camelus dromedarius]
MRVSGRRRSSQRAGGPAAGGAAPAVSPERAPPPPALTRAAASRAAAADHSPPPACARGHPRPLPPRPRRCARPRAVPPDLPCLRLDALAQWLLRAESGRERRQGGLARGTGTRPDPWEL